jgi:excisionase family DNA binding protein
MNAVTENGQKTDHVFDPKYPVAIAARMLGVSKQTVYRLIAACALKCYKIGDSIRIGKSHIEEYLR